MATLHYGSRPRVRTVARADDESFWRRIRHGYDLPRGLINLNNGGVCPTPRPVLAAMERFWRQANLAPVRTMWEELAPRVEKVRTRLAELFGCGADELAITRNASESMQILLLGLPLRRGDEILTTDQDYPRMVTTIRQRVRRDGARIRTISVPAPARSQDELFDCFTRAVTPRTRVILVSQVGHMTGQLFPTARLCRFARRRGIECLVDGAHAFAHLSTTRDDLGCDFFGTSLHKWLGAPFGTGLLYLRRRRIGDVWPLQPAELTQERNIRKFEEIGTHAVAPRLAIGAALDFHRRIGAARKLARLRWLRERWTCRLAGHERVRFRTNLAPDMSASFATFAIDGLDSREVRDWLWRRHRILVSWIDHPVIHGIRITPNVYTAPGEVDRFCDAIESLLRRGLR